MSKILREDKHTSVTEISLMIFLKSSQAYKVYNNMTKKLIKCYNQDHLYLLANCDDTQARPHFRLVNINFKAFVHCSSELNCILK